MLPLHKVFLGLIAFTSLSASALVAQSPVPKALIREQVNDNQLITLRGNTPPAANARNDAGRVSAAMPMTGLVLVLRRSPEVQAAFDAFVESQYDPTSPNFHQWLTPEQVGQKFGPALADIAAVSSWLSGHGLSVDEISKDRMTIRFSGSARQVEAAFHTELHNLSVSGESHFANMSDPQIPTALEPVVLGPKALHNFIPRPLHRTAGKAALNRETGKWQRMPEPNSAAISVPKADTAITGPARPDIVFSCGSGCLEEDVTPYDFAAIYNLTPLWTAGIDGTGQTIAIAGRSDVKASDVSSFRSTFGLTGGSYTQIINGADPGACTAPNYTSTIFCTLDDQIENALDVEWAGATAPKAAVKLVVTKQTASNDAIYDSASYIINNNVAKIINVSYGLCELGLGTTGNSTYNTLWQTAESAGISVFVATGDSGSPACDQGQASQGPYGANFGLAVNGIGSTPHNSAVGGTDLNWDSTNQSQYWNTSSDSHGATAKGYIKEIPWNDTCTNQLEVDFINSFFHTTDSAATICDKIATGVITSNSNPQGVLNLVNTVGAGGGKSNCTTNDNSTVASCTGGYAKPSWQTAVTGIPTDSKRDIPDVSFFAGNGFLSSAYLICVADWGTCVTSTGAGTEPSVGEIGGTSAASPAMAGIMALINQKAGSAQGNPNSQLYQLGAKQNYANCKTESVTNSGACYFNDIHTSTISMPCAGASPNCSLTATTSNPDDVGILSGFDATAGYDLASGLGSMNVANVVNAWTATGISIATVNVTASPSSFSTEQGTTVTVAVTGSSGTPTGTVFLKSGSFTSATQPLAADGTASIAIAAGVLSPGTDTISALYSGDATYAAAAGSKDVTVTQVGYTISASAASPASIAKGGSATSTITVTGTNGYAGSVSLACSLTSSPVGATNSPTCTVTGSPISLTASSTTGTATATVKTTAATSASLAKPHVNGWAQTGGTAVLAFLVFLGIPARRRGWRATCGMIALLLTIGSIAACGGGGGSSGGGGGGNPGTTSGTYTFTVTPTGNPAISPNPSATITVVVN